MIKREPLMNEEHFDKDIFLVSQATQQVTETMAQYQDQAGAYFDLLQHRSSLLYAHYSRGYPIAQTAKDLLRLLETWEKQRVADTRRLYYNSFREDLSNYVEGIGLLSLAHVLRTTPEVTNRLLICIGNEGQDLLFERLAAYIVPDVARKPANKLLYPKAYQPLYDALDAPVAQQADLVRQFLKGWYKGIKAVGWHDAHKGPDGGGFVGYWCWEAAGVALAFGIEDTSFRNLPYYPKDLAEFAQRHGPA